MYGNVPGYEGSLAGGGELSSLFHRLHTPAQGSGQEGGVAGGVGVVKNEVWSWKGSGQEGGVAWTRPWCFVKLVFW